MRLLLVCKSLPSTFRGGIQTHTWELSGHLRDRGCHVTLLTGGPWRGEPRHDTRDGRTVIRLPYLPGRRLPVLRKTVEDLAFNLAAAAWLRRHRHEFDCIHVQGRSGCLYAALARPPDSPPVVTTFHRLLAIEYAYDGQRAGWLDARLHRSLLGWIERRAARHSDRIIAVSREMARELAAACPTHRAPLRILPNGVSAAFGAPIVASPAPWGLVFVGRLERIKGIYPLVEAMRQVDPRITLTLVGDGPERRALERLSLRYGLQSRLRFIGDQGAAAVRYHIQRAHALVLPSFHESQGIVLLEAAICGRPVVAADVPGIDEVVVGGVTGLLHAPGQPPDLARAIDRLFADRPLATRLGAAGRERARLRYDWTQIAADTHALYVELLAGAKAARPPLPPVRSTHAASAKTSPACDLEPLELPVLAQAAFAKTRHDCAANPVELPATTQAAFAKTPYDCAANPVELPTTQAAFAITPYDCAANPVELPTTQAAFAKTPYDCEANPVELPTTTQAAFAKTRHDCETSSAELPTTTQAAFAKTRHDCEANPVELPTTTQAAFAKTRHDCETSPAELPTTTQAAFAKTRHDCEANPVELPTTNQAAFAKTDSSKATRHAVPDRATEPRRPTAAPCSEAEANPQLAGSPSLPITSSTLATRAVGASTSIVATEPPRSPTAAAAAERHLRPPSALTTPPTDRP